MNAATAESSPPRVTAASLVAHFATPRGRARLPLRNPHFEPRVGADARVHATPAAVLVPIVVRDGDLGVVLTRRHDAISHPGHICFPGGRADAGDTDPVDTALREAEEEIGLDRAEVRVIGRLGDYPTHSGFLIRPVVGLLTPPLSLVARDGEVEEILEFPLAHVLDPRAYRLRGGRWPESRAHYFIEHAGVVVAGPTVSLLMGLREELVATHTAGFPPQWGRSAIDRLVGGRQVGVTRV